MKSNNELSIIIPCFHEKDNLVSLIPQLIKLYPDSFIFIVDDNSVDGTVEFFQNKSKDFPQVFLISRKGKLGRGSAVLEGLKKALEKTKSGYYLEMDADFSHDPKEI